MADQQMIGHNYYEHMITVYEMQWNKDKIPGSEIDTDHDELIGSVACYGNEIDDLFVCSKYRHLGYGRKLLIWAMNHIQEHCDDSIILHVAAWNEHAVQMYKDSGFVIVKTEQVVS